MEKRQYKYLDTFRAIMCIAVLLYHLNLLPGGYLAVCAFFVLSGYLTTKSLLNKEKVDLIKHYTTRLKKVYIPLVVVVLASVAIITLQKDIVWVSLKPETTSVLFGYNNFWQISANLDYFARATNSPFTHLWYMAILLQFELVYPIVFIVMKKTLKLHPHMPTVVATVLAIGFTVYFLIYANQAPISAVYYNTFARVFSLFIGVSLCFIHYSLNKNVIITTKLSKPTFYGCLALLVWLFVILQADTTWYAYAMILASVISCLVIESAIVVDAKATSIDKFFKWIAMISYEIYLVQYPVIYLYGLSSWNQEDVYVNAFMISLITIIISIVIHFALAKKMKMRVLQIISLVFVLVISSFGAYQYVIAKDHTEEMKQLEAELAAHAEQMEKQNAEYEEMLKQENDAWEQLIAQLDPDEETIKQSVASLPIICIGDSVMLGASSAIKKTFSNVYIDAKVSRTAYVMEDILKKLKIQGPVVIHAGTNGDVPESVKDRIMKVCGKNDVFWITVTNDKNVNVNDDLKKLVKKYDNAYLIDWNKYAKGHTEWFYGDRIHLKENGQKEYASLIYDAIYQIKLAELEEKRDLAIAEREKELMQKYSFYGNDLLVGIYNQLNANYVEASFVADKELNVETLLTQMQDALNQKTLNYNVVLVLDSKFVLDEVILKKIKEICVDKQLCIFTTTESIDDDCIYSFASVLNNNPMYYSPDRVRLSDEGNTAFYQYVMEELTNKKEY